MRFTAALCAQHIGRMFRRHWRVQKERVPDVRDSEKILGVMGIPVYEPDAIIEENYEYQKIDVQHVIPEPLHITHSLYKEKICHMYKDQNVLLEGLNQGKLLTKTVEIKDGLPEGIENLIGKQKLPDQEKLVQRCILTSHVFDAMQVKLPKLHDPERPAWVFPRVYGINNKRKNILLSSKLIQLCELQCGGDVNRVLVKDGVVSVPFFKNEDLIQFELTADFLLCSSKPLPVYASSEVVQNTRNITLPDLYPLKCTVTLPKENIYELKNMFPILQGSPYRNVHTAIIHFDDTEVINLFETPVTEEQILGRTLLKAFAVAAACARQKFGADVKELPEPVTIQCVHTDSRLFHFSVLQLNTLDMDGDEGVKNIFWSLPRLPLFTSCTYEKGVPTLTGYNDEVFKILLAFFLNGKEN